MWLHRAMHFFTGRGRQKAVNLRNSPYVAVEGDAVRVSDHDQLEHLAKAWATKWDGRYQFVVRDGGFSRLDAQNVVLVVYAIRPTRVFAFTRGPSGSHTRHQF
jgi:hypothetical protein